jgi:hypothetical protein
MSSSPENGKKEEREVQLSVRSHGGRRGCLFRWTAVICWPSGILVNVVTQIPSFFYSNLNCQLFLT